MSKELCCFCKKGYLFWDIKKRMYICNNCGEEFFASNMEELVRHFNSPKLQKAKI